MHLSLERSPQLYRESALRYLRSIHLKYVHSIKFQPTFNQHPLVHVRMFIHKYTYELDIVILDLDINDHDFDPFLNSNINMRIEALLTMLCVTKISVCDNIQIVCL